MSLSEAHYGGEPYATSNESAALARSQRSLLLELRLVTAALAKNATLSLFLDKNFAADYYGSSDAAWLEANDLSSGQRYDDSSLPFPHIPIETKDLVDANWSGKNLHASISPIETPVDDSQVPRSGRTSPLDVDAIVTKASHATSKAVLTNESLELRLKEQSDLAGTAMGSSSALDITGVKNTAVVAPGLEDSILPEETSRPARTVHLPSEREQLKSLRERHASEQVEQFRLDHETTRQPIKVHLQTEQASSPCSTVGPYSATTPMPTQDSPDTSPNSEVDDVDALVPKDLRPSPAEKAAQEEHDRLLAAQKEIAKRAAMGDDANPGDQLRWEEREAVAREEEEQAAREKVSFSAGDVLDAIRRGQAEQFLARKPVNAKPIAQTSNEVTTNANGPDEENITVRPRDTAVPPTTTVHKTEPGEKLTLRKDTLTTDETRLLATRTQTAANDLQLPVEQNPHIATLPTRSTPTKLLSLSDLSVLKGAGDDPDRDYLEPLFRIQAHDSPNARTKPLPNLVKDAAKCLSTEDHYTTMHERLDYRILRRVYHLQNANKWSLRQMEKCKEPDQPVTHIDYMMAEMKWMRKDFKAERKLKKNTCAWLASHCAMWVAASPEARLAMQVKVKSTLRLTQSDSNANLPDLELSGDSAPEDEPMPSTPKDLAWSMSSLTVESDLDDVVYDLQQAGKLPQALRQLPVVNSLSVRLAPTPIPMTNVSKFVEGKVLPRSSGPVRKRSRYDYEDDAEELEAYSDGKRPRTMPPENDEVALFHPDNKHILNRLHTNNAFRPPSEFVMPSISFYEFRNGSQWIWEDDQKLRKLAKEYCFNWSLIADEMTLPSRYKSSAERRTPWECFERWVELETLPAEMRKTMYFKTWYQRLEQSQQAAERRYQAQVAAIQQAQNSQVPVPTRRRTNPTRVEKRKNSRYLWLVDAMRKLARKRETNAYKLADSQRLAAQRKAQTDSTQQPRGPMLTPQEFSKRRYERDLSIAEAQRQHRQKLLEAQQRQLQLARAAQQQQQQAQQQQQQQQQAHQQQGLGQGMVPMGQRPVPGNMPGHSGRAGAMNGQLPNNALQVNGQVPPSNRAAIQARTGQAGVPIMNGQSIPQAQMRPGVNMPQHADMQRLAQANAQRNAQYGNQAYHLNGNQGATQQNGVMVPQQQQQIPSNVAMLAQMNTQPQSLSQTHAGTHAQILGSNPGSHQGAASPNMPPPPTPHNVATSSTNVSLPQQLSSGHVPALLAIKNELRHKNPQWSEDQLNQAATLQLSQRSRDPSSTSVRQSAMNAAAGIHGANAQQFAPLPPSYQNAGLMTNGMVNYTGNEHGGSVQAMNQSPQAQAYAAQMRQRQMQMMRMQQQSASSGAHPQTNGSPGTSHASPNMAPASPLMAFNNTAPVPSNGLARPPSRSNTPQTSRVSASPASNVSMNNSISGNGMQSPGAVQSSPRVMQANMAR